MTGDAVVERKADVAYVSLFIRTDGISLEDAVRESTSKVKQVHDTLRETYREIRDIQIHEVYIGGERRPAMGFARDKVNPTRPEVVKSLFVTLPPNPELGVKIVDTACRLGSEIGNPGGFALAPNPQSAIMYGLAEAAEAQQEAFARAVADAKDKAWRLARTLERKLGPILRVAAMEFVSPEEITRTNKYSTLARAKYLSISAAAVEIPAKVSVSFELEG